MDKILIVGLDTIAGANLAATFKDRFSVTGVCCETEVSVAGCETEADHCDEALKIAQRVRADRIVLCGMNSQSGWEMDSRVPFEGQLLRTARAWGDAANKTKSELTLISSSSVFTGPWMFHDEESEQFSNSPEALGILAMEREIRQRVPQALIVRTHTYGWSPLGDEEGFAAGILNRLRIGETSSIDCVRHASPILATDLAEIVEKAFSAGLTGLLHIGGAERINPYRFSNLLADQFGYPCSVSGTLDPVGGRSSQFGTGESSLNCRRLRQELQIGAPLAAEGIQRFHQQVLGDFRDQFQVIDQPARNLVA